MIPLAFNYATPSVFEERGPEASLGFSADRSRPVHLHARVSRDVLSVRLALQTLGSLIWSQDEWLDSDTMRALTLDPVVTVHPDRVFFEAFSADESAYGLVIVDRTVLEPEGTVHTGTTNVDFTAWLWAALAEMRSSRNTWLRVGAEGFGVHTQGAGGRFERKVDVPDSWVRGFLQLQGAMAMPGTRLSVRPVDLVAALRYLRFAKAKVSPRALRWEITPGRDATLLLEPWEARIPLKGAGHDAAGGPDGGMRAIRTWGRRRLKLIEPLLPYAERVEVYLKGRALPHFYAVKLPSVTFVLGLSGWSTQRWTESSSFDLLAPPSIDPSLEARALGALRESYVLSADEIAARLAVDRSKATAALVALCAQGLAIFDVESRRFRHRALFATPVDTSKLFPPDPRREEAARIARDGALSLTSLEVRETRRTRSLKTPDGPVVRELILRDHVAHGAMQGVGAVETVLSDEDRLIFGRCECAFFRENLLNKGPCAHLLVLADLSRAKRRDEASSNASDPAALQADRAARSARQGARDPDADADGDENAHALDDEGDDDA